VKNTEALFRAVNSTFRRKGLFALLKRYINFLLERLYWRRDYYIFEYDSERLEELNDNDYMPRISGFEFAAITSISQIGDMPMGIADSLWHGFRAEEALRRGAIACLTRLGDEPAHVWWAAPNEKAMDYMRVPPMKIDTSQGEYCTSSWTNPKYRRMGFAQYTGMKGVQAIRARGLTRNLYTINKRNVPSLRAFGPPESKLCAEARHLKVLWWRFWKERPLDSG
jgi:hypothetical protein